MGEGIRGLPASRCAWCIAAAMLLAAVVGLPKWTVSAQGAGQTLTVHVAVCPVDYAGTAYVADCAENPGADFRVAAGPGSAFQLTNGDGLVDLDVSDLTPGTIVVRVLANDPDGAADALAEASCAAGDSLLDVTLPDTGFAGAVVALEATADADIWCDLFFVPLSFDQNGTGPADGTDSASSDDGETGDNTVATALPHTGGGV